MLRRIKLGRQNRVANPINIGIIKWDFIKTVVTADRINITE